MIAGDAFVTVKQDSFYKVLIQKEAVNGPPPYLATNWTEARESVRKLDALQPHAVIAGHGTHMDGQKLRDGLHTLAVEFDDIALPKYGKYVDENDKEK